MGELFLFNCSLTFDPPFWEPVVSLTNYGISLLFNDLSRDDSFLPSSLMGVREWEEESVGGSFSGVEYGSWGGVVLLKL